MPRFIPPSVYQFVVSASTDARSNVTPFWHSDIEGIPEEGMYLLASELDLPDTADILANVPIGYEIVFNIFNWEQSRAGEGFAIGIENSGVDLVAAAAESYELVGMGEEAHALRQVIGQYAQDPNDYGALSRAYEGTANPYRDDWNRIPHLVRMLCAGADRYFYVDTEA